MVVVIVVVIVVMIMVVIMIVVVIVIVRVIDDHDDATLVAVPAFATATVAMVAEAPSHGQHICGGNDETCDAGHDLT